MAIQGEGSGKCACLSNERESKLTSFWWCSRWRGVSARWFFAKGTKLQLSHLWDANTNEGRAGKFVGCQRRFI